LAAGTRDAPLTHASGRIAALHDLPDVFEFALLRARFAEIGELWLRRILN
jgi:hypothetical protein